MSFRWPHIFLIAGMLLVIGSFFFFAFDWGIYSPILLTGIGISGISFCIVLFRRDSKKSKLAWVFVVLIGIAVQRLSEPLIIRLSYVLLIKKNEPAFSKINDILLSKIGDATWVVDSTLWQRNNISKEEGIQIRDLLANKRIGWIQKDSSRIFYMTFSMLDIMYGVSYYYLDKKPDVTHHMTGNWYY